MTAIARIITTNTNKLIEETNFDSSNELGIRKAATDHIKMYLSEHNLPVKVELIYLNRPYGQATKSECVE